MSTRREKRDEREERRARREARLKGYEYRPGAARSTDEARRLTEGFDMIRESEDDDGDGD